MKDSEMRVEIVRCKNVSLPLVEVTYTGKGGKECKGLMLLDTCSTDNVLMGDVASSMKTSSPEGADRQTIFSLGDEKVEMPYVKTVIGLGGERHEEEFLVSEEFQVKVEGDRPFVGVLGFMFMLEHQLVIDFPSYTVYSPSGELEDAGEGEFDYLFPMLIGLEKYGMPVVGIKGKDSEIVALLDTGSHDSIITKSVLPELGTDYTLTDDTSLTSGVAGSVESKRVVADFNLMSAGNKKMEPRTLMRSDTFYAVDCTLSSSSQPIDTPADERYPDVKVLLGAGFMDTQGLTIDFARGIIYQRHVERTA